MEVDIATKMTERRDGAGERGVSVIHIVLEGEGDVPARDEERSIADCLKAPRVVGSCFVQRQRPSSRVVAPVLGNGERWTRARSPSR